MFNARRCVAHALLVAGTRFGRRVGKREAGPTSLHLAAGQLDGLDRSKKAGPGYSRATVI